MGLKLLLIFLFCLVNGLVAEQVLIFRGDVRGQMMRSGGLGSQITRMRCSRASPRNGLDQRGRYYGAPMITMGGGMYDPYMNMPYMGDPYGYGYGGFGGGFMDPFYYGPGYGYGGFY